MSVLVAVSDAHLRGPDDPVQAGFLAWLARVECDELLLLGDIFHHWWGFPGTVHPPWIPVVEALRRLHGSGVHLRFVPGNHDFHLGPDFTRFTRAQVSTSVARDLHGRRFFFAHGDEADRSVSYAVTKRILRGRPFAWALDRVGEERAQALLQRLAGEPRGEQGAAPSEVALAQAEWGRGLLGRVADVVIVGHVHRRQVHLHPQGLLIQMGGWWSHRAWVRIEDGRVELREGSEAVVWSEPAARGLPD